MAKKKEQEPKKEPKKAQPTKRASTDINLLMYDTNGKLVRVAINPKYRDELLKKFDWSKVPNAADVPVEWFA